MVDANDQHYSDSEIVVGKFNHAEVNELVVDVHYDFEQGIYYVGQQEIPMTPRLFRALFTVLPAEDFDEDE